MLIIYNLELTAIYEKYLHAYQFSNIKNPSLNDKINFKKYHVFLVSLFWFHRINII